MTSAVPRLAPRTFSRDEWDAALSFLCRVFGYDSLRPEQARALDTLFVGTDLLALLPTGYGKTVSFTGLVILYDYLFNGPPGTESRLQQNHKDFFRPVLFVISPLTQLILNHVRDFNRAVADLCPWLKAVCAYNPQGEPLAQQDPGVKSMYTGRGNIYFLAPGHVTGDGRFRTLLQPTSRVFQAWIISFVMKPTVSLAGVTSFARNMLCCTPLALLSLNIPCGVFTATLPPEDQLTLQKDLHLRDMKLVQASSDRPNIFLENIAYDSSDPEPELFLDLISELKAKGQHIPKLIIYCKRKSDARDYCEYVADEIGQYSGLGLIVDVISADLNARQVKDIVDAFLSEDSYTRVLFASEVLGMGIDIKGLYRVWVLGQCSSLRDFAQLFGRAGRDGKESKATLFTSTDSRSFPTEPSMKSYCEGGTCLRLQLAKFFDPTISFTAIQARLSQLKITCCCSVCDMI